MAREEDFKIATILGIETKLITLYSASFCSVRGEMPFEEF